jgi:hypothetical protein
MTRRGSFVAGVVGAVLGLAAVVIVAVLVRANVIPFGSPANKQDVPGTLVALVLPAEDGVRVPRVLVYYPSGGGSGLVVDPRTEVAVPGTSANSLADAYSFGGGDGLARGYAAAAGVATPGWVVVDEKTWPELANGRKLLVPLEEPIDVFNGVDLVSFPSGVVSVGASETASLMAGTDHLDRVERAKVLLAVAEGVQGMLASRASSAHLATNETAEVFSAWQTSLVGRGAPIASAH